MATYNFGATACSNPLPKMHGKAAPMTGKARQSPKGGTGRAMDKSLKGKTVGMKTHKGGAYKAGM